MSFSQLHSFIKKYQAKQSTTRYYSGWQRLHIDFILLALLVCLIGFGLVILYSASNQDPSVLHKQEMRMLLAIVLMLVFAQIPPQRYRQWTPWIFGVCLSLLFAVLVLGVMSKGAQRWLSFGFFRFQPSEIMKIAMPMMLAWFLQDRPLPILFKDLVYCGILILLPTFFIIKQPDLGTAIMVGASGFCVLFLAGLRMRFIAWLALIAIICAPILWHFMHDYQHQRVLTFLNPERDPLGTGYHIIQSKIAIGSGGILGKGWMHGTQSHLNFLPEHATDFIFAVVSEEFGLFGVLVLLALYLCITLRCMWISLQAQDTFTRLLAGSLGLTFFISFFVNMGMVSGILPVVGIPLPLVSYGGTSMVTLLISFGILMSIHTHRKLLTT